MGKICQACQAEPGDKSCSKCGRVVGKKCFAGSMCKDCNKGVA